MTNKMLAVSVFLGTFIIFSVNAAHGEGVDQGLKDRLNALDARIKEDKAEKYAEVEKVLQAIEGEAGLSEDAKVLVYQKFLELYAASSHTDPISKRTEYAKKLCSLPSADVKLKTEVLNKMAKLNNFNERYVYFYHGDILWPQAEIDRMEKDYRFAIETLVKLNPDNFDCRMAIAEQCLLDKAADKAVEEFNIALKIQGLTPRQQAEAMLGLISAALLKGDQAAAIKHGKEIVQLKVPSAGRGTRNPVDEAKYYLSFASPDLDYLKLPYYTEARAFPTPQQAKYSEEFVPLTSVKLVLGNGIKGDDARVGLLKTKFGRFGVKFDDNATFTIKINVEAEPKAPEKPEGYALTVTKTGATINSHDAQGTLWGIVSLIQLVDHEQAPKVRVSEIFDYPIVPVRGFLQDTWPNALEYMLFCKMNTVVAQKGTHLFINHPGRPVTPLQRETCNAQSQMFNAFGLRYYYGIMDWTMFYPLALSSERTFELQRDIFLEIAKYGGHVYFPFDDIRFPVMKADLEKYGAAANMDAKHITRVFQAVRKQYPGFQMVFCPPFYWGPDSGSRYPEPREPYLKSIGEFLDPEIDVFWTGPQVKGLWKNKKQVTWYTDLIKRKPIIFQNASGQHNLFSYITDKMPEWIDWHDGHEGFFDQEISGFLRNSHMGSDAADTAKLADCLWNFQAYSQERQKNACEGTARRAVALLYGKDMFDILDPAMEAVASFDKYEYGSFKPEALKELPELEKKLAIAKDAWKKAEEYNAFSLEQFPGALRRAIFEFAEGTVREAKKKADQATDGKAK